MRKNKLSKLDRIALAIENNEIPANVRASIDDLSNLLFLKDDGSLTDEDFKLELEELMKPDDGKWAAD